MFRIVCVFFISIVSFSAFSMEECSVHKSLSEIYQCEKFAYEKSMDNLDKIYGSLISSVEAIPEYKESITLSQEQWNKTVKSDCANYSYFIEEGSITYDIENLHCLTFKVDQRNEYLLKLLSRAKDFL
ncbi:DUF1311 domain-containing protein [Vibrio sp. Of7-15]|uniref:lysozyme inhibitor LprI family protein n=1 Tax=Vibrio sp. Of7-15 TaxID=2724879 RepID=UPI001EF320D6|nr:lysozyme inhibitor LprI family protein [Vibrio sp. Of7-15]MCG7498060.1 DUF1311 domain-containing protein [Vibrio sp. Of7-15]